MGNTSRQPASNVLRQQQQQYRSAFCRQISSTTRASSRRAVPQTPSFALRQQLLAQRSYSSGSQGKSTPPKGSNNQIKFWPFVVVIALGSGGYMLLVNKQKSELLPT
jgi:UMP-CMP kinase